MEYISLDGKVIIGQLDMKGIIIDYFSVKSIVLAIKGYVSYSNKTCNWCCTD